MQESVFLIQKRELGQDAGCKLGVTRSSFFIVFTKNFIN